MGRHMPLVLSEAATGRIGSILADLLDKTRADAALVIRQDGRLLASAGKLDGLESENLSAVIAGCVANAREIADLLKDASFALVYNRGEGRYLHSALIDDDTILSLLIGPQSSLEAARQRSQQLGAAIADVLVDARVAFIASDQAGADDDLDNVTRERLNEVFDGGPQN